MKAWITLLVFAACLPGLASATIRTVSNYTPIPAQFTDIGTAMGAAVDGDTIYVHGSPMNYPTIFVSKRLVFIGPGFHPNTDYPYAATIWPAINILLAGNGSSFNSLACSNIQHFAGGGNDTVRNLTFRNCFLYQGGFSIAAKNYQNILFENCIFSDLINPVSLVSSGATYQVGLVVRNCIFSNSVLQVEANSIVDHCIFIGSNTGIHAFSGSSASTFSNNIFHSRTIDVADASACVFNNNITYNCSNNAIPLAGNTGSGNIANQNPQFTTYPGAATSFDYAHNYRLQVASPGHNAGTDGTDLGVYGNSFSFARTGESPFLPVMRKLDIYNTTVPLNGTLDVRYKSTVPVTD